MFSSKGKGKGKCGFI